MKLGTVPEDDGLEDLKALVNELEARVARLESNLEQNLKLIEKNLKKLAKDIISLKEKVSVNTQNYENLLNRVMFLESQLQDYLNDLGGALGNIETFDERLILQRLEQQIEDRGGINIGDRWRIRFKDDENKDLFIQDRQKKGYYRFRTTDCNQVVEGCVTGKAC